MPPPPPVQNMPTAHHHPQPPMPDHPFTHPQHQHHQQQQHQQQHQQHHPQHHQQHQQQHQQHQLQHPPQPQPHPQQSHHQPHPDHHYQPQLHRPPPPQHSSPPHHPNQPPPSQKPRPPPTRPSFTLSQNDTTLLANTYADFLALLRPNPFAAEWIFAWVLSAYPSHHDAARLNLSLSRGFRAITMCSSRGCASLEPKSLLHKSSTLLLPAQSRDSVVVGYFMDSAIDQTSSPALRTGKYVYCPTSRELFKVSKVRGPPSASRLFSVCITRTCLVGTGMFLKDYVMASFPWQEYAGRVPEHCIAHSRTLSFHKLVQTAQEAGLQGHGSDNNTISSPDESVSEHSFYGIGTFGLYECALVPAKLGFGAQAEGDDPPPLSVGNWAIPEHSAFCHGHQALHLGMFRNETTSLRSQFVQVYGHVSGQIPRQVASEINANLDDNQHISADRVLPHAHRAPIADNPTHEPGRSAELLPFVPPNVAYGHKTVVSGFDNVRESSAAGGTRSVTATVPFSGTGQSADGGVVAEEAGQNRAMAGEAVAVSSGLLPEVSNPMVLPVQRQLAGQGFHGVGGEALDVPSSVVESIDAAVAAQVSSPSGERRGASAPATQAAVGFAGPGVGYGGPVVKSDVESVGTGKGQEGGAGMQTFKKTLPAPTKSEIVIRNRISAQRSNEKRRKKIEATKSELAYLKTTYLPHLEHKRGTLISENQSLRLKFMEKYQESDIDSFF